jgi:Zn-finger nucleic acid-binding protein
MLPLQTSGVGSEFSLKAQRHAAAVKQLSGGDLGKMKSTCPVCKQSTLSARQLENGLACEQCSECKGVWVGAGQYEPWLAVQAKDLPEKPPEEGLKLVSGEKPGGKFCPVCKYLMMKYRFGHEIDFCLNRCMHCGGMWFDSNEWEILASRNLADKAHLVFTASWQAAVRAEEHQAAMEDTFKEIFGEEDLKEIKRIKNWLDKHPKSPELYAYLMMDKDKMWK